MTEKLLVCRWIFDLHQWKPTMQELLLAVSSIQPEEKERLLKFVFRDDFDSSLIGRLLMRKFVQCVTNIPNKEITFGRDEHGKPFLINSLNGNHISFNVSHQGRYSILAGIFQKGSKDALIDIGVDVMKFEYSGGKSLTDFFRIMSRNFSDLEWTCIKGNLDEKDQLCSFMRHWCLKESYVKNIGVGITTDLKKISFRIKTKNLTEYKIVNDTELEVNNVLQTNWKFEEHLLDKEHCVSIAFKNWNDNIKHDHFQLINKDNLMQYCKPFTLPDEEYCKTVLQKEFKNKIRVNK